ncbi:cupin-like domain-containing protein [Novosphingopyxis sp.]|uniref:cupin-like domain-containing protein n=1 Tax=Novosphingopyxis sp. TaxID=2709690 RepID=UPI003B5B6509
MEPIAVRQDVTPKIFQDIRAAGMPAVMKGLVAGWPVVETGRSGPAATIAYLSAMATPRPVPFFRASSEIEGRLHYGDDLRAPNFERGAAPLAGFLAALGAEAARKRPDTLAVQGLVATDHLQRFAETHKLAILPDSVVPRLWIGNAAKVAIHHDPLENVACVAAGRRRFTLFPPDQLGNLYMGPFHLTPAGTQVSMVHLTDPDFERFPRFAAALDQARTAELAPGDALYIPYQWYHHVEALDAVNLLVNYWWDDARRDIGSPWDAMMHGMMTLRNLPPDQRRAWRAMFDHYVFLSGADPAAHLPPDARGILAANAPRDVARMRRALIAKLREQDVPER